MLAPGLATKLQAGAVVNRLTACEVVHLHPGIFLRMWDMEHIAGERLSETVTCVSGGTT